MDLILKIFLLHKQLSITPRRNKYRDHGIKKTTDTFTKCRQEEPETKKSESKTLEQFSVFTSNFSKQKIQNRETHDKQIETAHMQYGYILKERADRLKIRYTKVSKVMTISQKVGITLYRHSGMELAGIYNPLKQ